MADKIAFPALGFARGAVVRTADDAPNMLVVRSLEDMTMCLVIESDQGGQVRLRGFANDRLRVVLPAQTPIAPASAPRPDWAAPDMPQPHAPGPDMTRTGEGER